MLLLYCQNGIVVGQHDDTEQVDPARYDESLGNVRIIPWRGLVTDLPLYGPQPPDQYPDTRPYAQPTETPQILMDYASQVRWEVVTEGITYNAMRINTDRTSQLMLSNLSDYIQQQNLNNNATVYFNQDAITYAITAGDANAIYTAVNLHVQNCRGIEAACYMDLSSASPTIKTYADVEQKFVGVRSGSLKHGSNK